MPVSVRNGTVATLQIFKKNKKFREVQDQFLTFTSGLTSMCVIDNSKATFVLNPLKKKGVDKWALQKLKVIIYYWTIFMYFFKKLYLTI